MGCSALGSKSRIIMQKEATYGVEPDGGSDCKILYFSSEGFNQERVNVDSVVIRGNRNAEKPVKGNINVTGAITTELQAYIGSLYYGAMGNAVSADVYINLTADPTGTFTIGEKVTGGTSAAEGIFMAVVGTGAAAQLAVYVASGTFVVDETLTGGDSAATATVDAAVPTTAIAAAPYYHLAYVGDEIPSWTFEKEIEFDSTDSTFFRYYGCKVNTLSMTASPEGMQDVSFELIGGSALPDFGDNTELTSSFSATPTDLGKESFDALGVGTVEVDGSDATGYVTSIDLSHTNNLDDSIYTLGGGGERTCLPAGMGVTTGTLNILFNDTNGFATFQKAIDFDEVKLHVGWANGTGLGTAGNESIDFYMPETVLSVNTPVIDGPTGVQVGFAFNAYYQNYGTDTGYESGMYVLLKNTQSDITA